jgi:hypothetical protein
VDLRLEHDAAHDGITGVFWARGVNEAFSSWSYEHTPIKSKPFHMKKHLFIHNKPSTWNTPFLRQSIELTPADEKTRLEYDH